MVKIWQERPLTHYTFVKLFKRDAKQNTAVGNRVLVYRGNLLGDPSPACRFPSTGSASHMQQAQSWLQDCKTHHLRCNGVGNTLRHLPARLINILPNSNPDISPVIKIESMDSANEHVEYLAFSHCWGGPELPFRLLESNKEDLFKGIEFRVLSKNMQDAVRVTRSLGYKYLWIDSLCIIQDSSEDWKIEAAKMGDVYAGAVCTIASTGSASSQGGCFHSRNTLSLRPCKIGVSSLTELLPEYISIRRDDLSDFRRGVDRAILNTRGWVLQERLLSRRILHFGAELLYWECCQRAASETNATGYVYKSYPREFGGNFILTQNEPWVRASMITRRLPAPDFESGDGLESGTVWKDNRAFLKEIRRPATFRWSEDLSTDPRFRSALDKLQSGVFGEEEIGMASFSHCWYEIVESYTRSNLTFSKDKLIAIAGLVRQIQNATKFEYLAGLWREHLVMDLLWFTAEGPGHRLLETSPPEKKIEAASIPEESSAGTISTAKEVDGPALKDIEGINVEVAETSAERQKEVPEAEGTKATLIEPTMELESSPTESPEEGATEALSREVTDRNSPQNTDEASIQLQEASTAEPATVGEEEALHLPTQPRSLNSSQSETPTSPTSSPTPSTQTAVASLQLPPNEIPTVPLLPGRKPHLMAPTWSWASLSGPVTNDLLPENAMRKVHGTPLITIHSAVISPVPASSSALSGFLEVEGPLSGIASLTQVSSEKGKGDEIGKGDRGKEWNKEGDYMR
ncbi:hypothetical protein G7Y89_g15235 [Cudoniella acicularis]|uniref:Heterokaryon incompatibility domain-containing protein n=1 Tax=Cudoniella acicularis TaxID=354080 RepID=A0A8H4QSF9_9HELO|nr:hypothetical protein G7Y89_g15235 [Cudoniella acicularis]